MGSKLLIEIEGGAITEMLTDLADLTVTVYDKDLDENRIEHHDLDCTPIIELNSRLTSIRLDNTEGEEDGEQWL